MMSEIYARGPITCGFASVDDFDYNYVSSTQHHTTSYPTPLLGCAPAVHTHSHLTSGLLLSSYVGLLD